MSTRRKRTWSRSQYVKELLRIIDKYVDETGDKTPDLHKVSAWAHANGLAEPHPYDAIKHFAKELARAAREDFIEDENGEPIRLRHSVKIKSGGEQLTFWFKMEDATPENMRLSAQARRRGARADVFQIVRDVNYFNKRYNPGDPIQLDFNFNKDIEEQQFPTEYPDAPPTDDQ